MSLDILIFLRHIRVFGLFAFPETFATLLLIWFILRKSNNKSLVRTLLVLSITLTITIATHFIFKVNTQLNYMLGLAECPPDYNSVTGIFTC